MGEAGPRRHLLETLGHHGPGIHGQDGQWCLVSSSGTRCRHYCNSGCWQGWVTSDDPRKRQFEVKHGEAESIKAEMSSLARRRQSEHREIMSEVQLTMAKH